MRLKTKYRMKDGAAAEMIPAVPDHPVENFDSFEEFEKSLSTSPNSMDSKSNKPIEPIADSPQPENVPPPEPAPQAASQDDASIALQRQIEALKRSEEIQRERVQQQNVRPVPQMEPSRLQWLQQTPLAQANYAMLAPLHAEVVRLGVPDLSVEYFAAMERGLVAMVQEQQQPEQQPQVQQQPEAAPMEQPPKFFAPAKPQRLPSGPTAASRVSAPVSRTMPGGYRVETNPRNVTLTALEREIARSSGITDLEYAQQKLRLQREKAEGLHSQGQ